MMELCRPPDAGLPPGWLISTTLTRIAPPESGDFANRARDAVVNGGIDRSSVVRCENCSHEAEPRNG